MTKALSLGGDFKVFWYKSMEQVRLLFDDYLLLIERSGFLPPRYIVEANVLEIVHLPRVPKLLERILEVDILDGASIHYLRDCRT